MGLNYNRGIYFPVLVIPCTHRISIGDAAIQHSLGQFHVQHGLVRILRVRPRIPHCDADLYFLIGASYFDWFCKPEAISYCEFQMIDIID